MLSFECNIDTVIGLSLYTRGTELPIFGREGSPNTHFIGILGEIDFDNVLNVFKTNHPRECNVANHLGITAQSK